MVGRASEACTDNKGVGEEVDVEAADVPSIGDNETPTDTGDEVADGATEIPTESKGVGEDSAAEATGPDDGKAVGATETPTDSKGGEDHAGEIEATA